MNPAHKALATAYHNAIAAATVAGRPDLIERAVGVLRGLGVGVAAPRAVTSYIVAAYDPASTECWDGVNVLRQLERLARPTLYVEPAPASLDELGEALRRRSVGL